MADKDGRSPFIRLFETSFGLYLYDVNKNKILELPENVYAYLDGKVFECDDSIEYYLKDLERKGYLRPNQVQISEHIVTEYYDSFLQNNLSQLVLQVTQRCNLNCEYCSYSGNYMNRSHANRNMPFDIVRKSIDFLVAHSRDADDLSIGFYGGEPLLEFDLIKKAVEYAGQVFEGRIVHYSFTTNATLLTEDKFEFLVKNNFSILISLDGPEEVQNRHRKFANSEIGSFKIIMQNIKKLQDQYPQFFEKQVAFNSVMDPTKGLCDICDFTSNNECIKDSPFMSSVIDSTYAKKAIAYSEKFAEELEYEKFKVFLWKIGRVDKNNISPLMRQHFAGLKETATLLERINQDTLPEKGHRGGPCIPGVRKLFVMVDGVLYPCEKVSEISNASCIGHIDTGIDIKKALKLLNIERITSDKCQQCWAYRLCYLCVAQADDGHEISASKILNRCEVCKNVIEENIKDYVVLRKFGYNYQLDR